MIKSSMTTNGFAFVSKTFVGTYCFSFEHSCKMYVQAFQKGSPLVHEISRAIAGLREKGKLEEMEKKWLARESWDVSPHTICLLPSLEKCGDQKLHSQSVCSWKDDIHFETILCQKSKCYVTFCLHF